MSLFSSPGTSCGRRMKRRAAPLGYSTPASPFPRSTARAGAGRARAPSSCSSTAISFSQIPLLKIVFFLLEVDYGYTPPPHVIIQAMSVQAH